MTETLTKIPVTPETASPHREEDVPVNFLIRLALSRETSKHWIESLSTNAQIKGDYVTSVFASAFNLETLAVIGLRKHGVDLQLNSSNDRRMLRAYTKEVSFMSAYCTELRSIFDWAENPINKTAKYIPSLFDPEELLIGRSKDEIQTEKKFWMTSVIARYLDVKNINFDINGSLKPHFREYEDLTEQGLSPYTLDEFNVIADTINREAIAKIKQS